MAKLSSGLIIFFIISLLIVLIIRIEPTPPIKRTDLELEFIELRKLEEANVGAILDIRKILVDNGLAHYIDENHINIK